MQRRVKRGWMPLKVDEVVDETHDTKTFLMSDADDGGRPFDFVAGQYLTFRFDDVAEKPVVRSYTMSGSPRQENQSIFTVKRVEGDNPAHRVANQGPHLAAVIPGSPVEKNR